MIFTTFSLLKTFASISMQIFFTSLMNNKNITNFPHTSLQQSQQEFQLSFF